MTVIRELYDRIRANTRLDEARANEIVRAAYPHVAPLLAPGPDGGVQVTAHLVPAAEQRGGSVIPAWPLRNDDGSVRIEFVEDWGAMLAVWCASAGDEPDTIASLVALVRSGDRQWVGIANDVLQLYVPNPPEGTYSMVRHHALMLVAATLWLGPERSARWLEAHSAVARAFLARLDGRGLWDAIEAAERGLGTLLADSRSGGTAEEVVSWLEADDAAATTFRDYVGTASLGLAALLATVPADADITAWVRACIENEHPAPDFNRDRIEAFAQLT